MNIFKSIPIILVLISATACSMVGRIEEVRPDPSGVTVNNHHSGRIIVRVAGGDDQFVSRATFQQALIDSINATKVFESAASSGNTPYELRVMTLEKRHSGLGYDHWTSTEWMLRDSKGTEIWRQKIKAKGHAIHFGGTDRFRSSAERSSRAVISVGIKALGELKF